MSQTERDRKESKKALCVSQYVCVCEWVKLPFFLTKSIGWSVRNLSATNIDLSSKDLHFDCFSSDVEISHGQNETEEKKQQTFSFTITIKNKMADWEMIGLVQLNWADKEIRRKE